MSFLNQAIGYASAIIVASLFYLASMCLAVAVAMPSLGIAGYPSILEASKFVLILGISIAAIMAVLMIVPWLLAIWAYPRQRYDGRLYFAAFGAVSALLVGCVTSALSPALLFIEDQTFFRGIMIAAERQGISLVVAGLAGGFTYWFVAERKRSKTS